MPIERARLGTPSGLSKNRAYRHGIKLIRPSPLYLSRMRKSCIHFPRRLAQGHDPGSARESGSTLIGCDMTVLSDPAQEQINASARFDLLFVGFARLLWGLGGPVQKIDLGSRDVDCNYTKQIRLCSLPQQGPIAYSYRRLKPFISAPFPSHCH